MLIPRLHNLYLDHLRVLRLHSLGFLSQPDNDKARCVIVVVIAGQDEGSEVEYDPLTLPVELN